MQGSAQKKQKEWLDQWSMFPESEESFLFRDWIAPATLESLQGLEVLEAGCGHGQHTFFMAPFAKNITAVDLNTTSVAREKNKNNKNVNFIEADIATMNLNQKFDVVVCIGVIHHTDNPDKTVENLIRHLKPGGRLILWVYSKEGNFLVEKGVEPVRRLFLKYLPRSWILKLSQLLTILLLLPVYTLYLLPLSFLPYYEYFKNFRKLSFNKNVLNVFDKLNAPQVEFISHDRAFRWMKSHSFQNIHISSYCGVSWRISGNL